MCDGNHLRKAGLIRSVQLGTLCKSSCRMSNFAFFALFMLLPFPLSHNSCESSRGNRPGEAAALLSAGHLFLEAEKKMAELKCVSVLENLDNAYACYNLAAKVTAFNSISRVWGGGRGHFFWTFVSVKLLHWFREKKFFSLHRSLCCFTWGLFLLKLLFFHSYSFWQ